MLVCLFVEVFAVLENPGIRQRISNDRNVNIVRYVSYVCSVYVAVSCSLFGSVCISGIGVNTITRTVNITFLLYTKLDLTHSSITHLSICVSVQGNFLYPT